MGKHEQESSNVPVDAITYWIEQDWDLSDVLEDYLREHHPDALTKDRMVSQTSETETINA